MRPFLGQVRRRQVDRDPFGGAAQVQVPKSRRAHARGFRPRPCPAVPRPRNSPRRVLFDIVPRHCALRARDKQPSRLSTPYCYPAWLNYGPPPHWDDAAAEVRSTGPAVDKHPMREKSCAGQPLPVRIRSVGISNLRRNRDQSRIFLALCSYASRLSWVD